MEQGKWRSSDPENADHIRALDRAIAPYLLIPVQNGSPLCTLHHTRRAPMACHTARPLPPVDRFGRSTCLSPHGSTRIFTDKYRNAD